MSELKIETVSAEEYRLYNLVIERLTKVIEELTFAISNCKDLEGDGWDMNLFMLQDGLVDIARVYAETVNGLKYIKPKESK